jgi:hypothetical protein
MQTVATPTVPKQLRVEQLLWPERVFTVRASAPSDAPLALTSAKAGHRRDLVVPLLRSGLGCAPQRRPQLLCLGFQPAHAGDLLGCFPHVAL